MVKINEKQKRLVDEFIIHANVYRAAINAGYSDSYAKVNAHKTLEKASVKAYKDKRLAELQNDRTADAQEIMEFLTSTIRGEVTEPILIGLGNGEQTLEYVKPNVNTRRQAAVDLGKRYAMWTEKHEHDHGGIEIEIDYGDADDDQNES